ncbi:hypothetical protein HXA34_20640 [Salipaludibacillus agaradhaerens]|uniref:CRISPR-associated protein Csx16 n=1 Tax=Salipaludibacillus agaradhaerens TaxID=76935 RepID=UPI002150AC9C|nr:CRISPR-associated protein Csx16 [Salipaludibacillus agaradhaerens]MCR6108708.1 hypothetical protein [Salipaludibacillus agaradhaerens]MCR6120731.1 hypothetical protein [Salipaludibacillus agaradhaerens]
MKIKDLLKTKKVTTSGFKAISELAEYSEGTEEVVLSSAPPFILAEQGISEYYALDIPRGSTFSTAQDIIDADLTVRKYRIEHVVSASQMDLVIASRHQGTVEILINQYGAHHPELQVFDSVTSDQIAGKHVIGTLPPHLIAAAGAYTAVSIKNFDYTKDGDITGDELKERLIIAQSPIRVKEIGSH